MAYTKEILTLAVEIGDSMLRNGGEIYRVEDTVLNILDAYEIRERDVYVLSNGIFASANEDQEDACSVIRHVPLASVNLSRLAALNQLARDICSHRIALVDAWPELERCNAIKNYDKRWLILAAGIGSAGFTFLFGGHAIDSAFAFFIGLLEQILLFEMEKWHISRIMKNIFASMFVNALSMLTLFTGLNLMQDKIVIGALMVLVPGIAFTTSIRDIYNGDYLSGTIHLLDALVTAACIAAGVCVTIFLGKYMGGVIGL